MMQKVSPAWRAETHKRMIGAAECRIAFGMIDTDAAPTASPRSSDAAAFSPLSSLFAASPPRTVCASLEPQRMRLDGTQCVFPAAAGKHSEGFVSSSLSSASAVFETPPVLHISFTKPHTVPSLSFVFDTVCNDWPTQLCLKAFAGDALLCNKTICPSAAVFVHREEIAGFDRLEIIFEQTSRPMRRVRLQQLMFGEGLIFTGKTLAKLTHKSVTDPTMRRLSSEKVSFSLINRNTLSGDVHCLYNLDNPEGVWRFVEQRAPLRLEYGQQLTGGHLWAAFADFAWTEMPAHTFATYLQGGETEWIDGGRYYLTAQPKVEGLYAGFEAEDALSLLGGTYAKSVYAPEGQSLYALAQAVLEDAALPVIDPGVSPWQLWEGLREIFTTAPLPMRSHRECLQLIAHAGCCVLHCNRTGEICLLPSPTMQSETLALPLSLQRSEPKAEKLAPLASVCCPATTYTPKADCTELHKATLTVNGTLRLSLTHALATAVVAVLTHAQGVTIESVQPFASSTTVTLTGSGTATLLLQGHALETSTTLHHAMALDAADGGVHETLTNPLITTPENALAVATLTRDTLQARTAYTLTTAGHPEASPLDFLQADTLFEPACTVQLLSHTLEWKGSLRSTLLTKRRDSLGH